MDVLAGSHVGECSIVVCTFSGHSRPKPQLMYRKTIENIPLSGVYMYIASKKELCGFVLLSLALMHPYSDC